MVSDFQKQGIETASFLTFEFRLPECHSATFFMVKVTKPAKIQGLGKYVPLFDVKGDMYVQSGKGFRGPLWRLVHKGSRKKWKEYKLRSQVALDFNLVLDPAVLLWAHYLTSLSFSF